MQKDAADKMDELLTLIEVSNELHKIKEPGDNYRDTP